MFYKPDCASRFNRLLRILFSYDLKTTTTYNTMLFDSSSLNSLQCRARTNDFIEKSKFVNVYYPMILGYDPTLNIHISDWNFPTKVVSEINLKKKYSSSREFHILQLVFTHNTASSLSWHWYSEGRANPCSHVKCRNVP